MVFSNPFLRGCSSWCSFLLSFFFLLFLFALVPRNDHIPAPRQVWQPGWLIKVSRLWLEFASCRLGPAFTDASPVHVSCAPLVGEGVGFTGHFVLYKHFGDALELQPKALTTIWSKRVGCSDLFQKPPLQRKQSVAASRK